MRYLPAVFLLFFSLTACGEDKETEETGRACPILTDQVCPEEMSRKYWCDPCGWVWFCGSIGGERVWSGGYSKKCECVEEDGGWDDEDCPLEP